MIDKNKLSKLREIMKMKGITQLLISDFNALYYLLGHWQDTRRIIHLLVKDAEEPRLFVSKLIEYRANVGVEVISIDEGDAAGMACIGRYLDQTKKIGVDASLPASRLIPLLEMGMAPLITSDLVYHMRAVKDEAEQQLMEENSMLNDAAMAAFKKLVRDGITELEIAAEIPKIYESLGFSSTAFKIVAFGANAANPHHKADNTVLKPGDAVLFDVGADRKHFKNDMTRTFYFKHITDLNRELHNIVLKANLEAEAAVRPGAKLKDIDAIARQVIKDAGFGDQFIHGLGHGIGLEAHECINLDPHSNDIAEPGMIFSIEPGIYLPGQTGVRIEDLVLVTEDGCRVLNHYNKEIDIIM